MPPAILSLLYTGFENSIPPLYVNFSNALLNKNSYSTKKSNLDTIINFNDLSLGDAVVHQKHGIGRFVSIDNIEVSNRIREFIRLIYRGNDKLLLPIENLNFITRYGFDDSSNSR